MISRNTEDNKVIWSPLQRA